LFAALACGCPRDLGQRRGVTAVTPALPLWPAAPRPARCRVTGRSALACGNRHR